MKTYCFGFIFLRVSRVWNGEKKETAMIENQAAKNMGHEIETPKP